MSYLLTFDVMSDAKSSEEIRKEFGRYLQRERESRGISQKFLAKKIEISETQLSRIETGKSGTERDTVIKWAKALGIDENDALRKYKPEYTILPEEILSLNLNGLDQNDINDIAKYIEFIKYLKVKSVNPEDLSALDTLEANPEFENKKSRAKNNAAETKK